MIDTIAYVHFKASECNVEIFINDISVFELECDGMMGSRVAINQFLIPGNNQISLTIKPLENGQFELLSHAEIAVNLDGLPASTIIPPLLRCAPEKETLRLPVLKAGGTFFNSMKTPLSPPWLAANLNEMKTNHQRFVAFYDKVLKTLQSKDIDAYMTLTAPKDEWYIAAYGLDKAMRMEELRKRYEAVIQSTDTTLLKIDRRLWQPIYAGNGQLFFYKTNGRASTVVLHHREKEGDYEIPVFLTIVDGKVRWVL